MNHSTKNEMIEQQALQSALQKAMSHHSDSNWDDINPELLVLLAQVRGQQIEPTERARLLKRIAGDPGLGAVLKTIHEDMDDVVKSPAIGKTKFILRLACTACVIALVFVATSVLTDSSINGKTVEVLDSGSGKNGFLDELGSTDPSALARLAGDPVFVGLFVLAVILGCGSFWPRKSPRT